MEKRTVTQQMASLVAETMIKQFTEFQIQCFRYFIYGINNGKPIPDESDKIKPAAEMVAGSLGYIDPAGNVDADAIKIDYVLLIMATDKYISEMNARHKESEQSNKNSSDLLWKNCNEFDDSAFCDALNSADDNNDNVNALAHLLDSFTFNPIVKFTEFMQKVGPHMLDRRNAEIIPSIVRDILNHLGYGGKGCSVHLEQVIDDRSIILDAIKVYFEAYEKTLKTGKRYKCTIKHNNGLVFCTSDITCVWTGSAFTECVNSKFTIIREYSPKYFYDIHEIPARRLTQIELYKWLAKGNGLAKCTDSTEYASLTHILIAEENVPVDDYTQIRKWDDTEWHEPTTDYVGIDNADN